MPRVKKVYKQHNRKVSKEKDLRGKHTNIHKDELGSFPLQNDPIYKALKAEHKKFVYNIFLQPITKWPNLKCYQDVYGKDMNYNVAGANSTQLLKNPKITHCIQIIREHYHKKLEITPDRIMQEEACIAFQDIAEFFNQDGYLTVHPSQLPENARRAISGFEEIHLKNGGVVYKVTTWDKGQSLKRLQAVIGMNAARKVELTGKDGGPIETSNTNEYDFSVLDFVEKRTLKELLDKCRRT